MSWWDNFAEIANLCENETGLADACCEAAAWSEIDNF